jgi:hypothetical protein
MHVQRIPAGLILWLGAAVSLSASPLLTLTPSSDLSGPPGSVAGWGFSITNDADYIEITGAEFCANPVNFPCASPTTGTFTDFISAFNDIIVGPPGGTDPSIVSQNFDVLAHTGIGSFEISPDVPAGASDVGQIVLTYNLTDLDPNDPNAQLLGTDLMLSANAAVTVSAPIPTPEPPTAACMAAALLLFGPVLLRTSRAAVRRGFCRLD